MIFSYFGFLDLLLELFLVQGGQLDLALDEKIVIILLVLRLPSLNH